MAEIVLIPTVVSPVAGRDDWTLGAGADKVAAVQGPSGDNTSYIRSPLSSGISQQYYLSAPSITESEAASVTQVEVRTEATCYTTSEDGTYIPILRIETVPAYQSGINVTVSNGAWSIDRQVIVNPRTGNNDDWTLSDLQDLEVRVRTINNKGVDVSWIEVIVTYTPDTPASDPYTYWGEVSNAVERTTVTGLTNDTTYEFYVTTVDEDGNESSGSSAVEGTPAAPPPDPDPDPPPPEPPPPSTIRLNWQNVVSMCFEVQNNEGYLKITHIGKSVDTESKIDRNRDHVFSRCYESGRLRVSGGS